MCEAHFEFAVGNVACVRHTLISIGVAFLHVTHLYVKGLDYFWRLPNGDDHASFVRRQRWFIGHAHDVWNDSDVYFTFRLLRCLEFVVDD